MACLRKLRLSGVNTRANKKLSYQTAIKFFRLEKMSFKLCPHDLPCDIVAKNVTAQSW